LEISSKTPENSQKSSLYPKVHKTKKSTKINFSSDAGVGKSNSATVSHNTKKNLKILLIFPKILKILQK
jgi:hypothetical protein